MMSYTEFGLNADVWSLGCVVMQFFEAGNVLFDVDEDNGGPKLRQIYDKAGFYDEKNAETPKPKPFQLVETWSQHYAFIGDCFQKYGQRPRASELLKMYPLEFNFRRTSENYKKLTLNEDRYKKMRSE
jgi:hypothetical protein